LIGNEWQLPGQTIEISKEYGLKSTVSKMIASPTKRAKESNAGKFNSDCVHFLRKYKSNYLQQVKGQLTRKQPRSCRHTPHYITHHALFTGKGKRWNKC